MGETGFTPALGFRFLTPLYDVAIATMTREKRWRRQLVVQIDPRPSDRILDVGCGTGTLAIQLKFREPGAEVVGIDPDAEVVARAGVKATKAGIDVTWLTGFVTPRLSDEIGTFSKVASSLVLHQTPIEEKRNILNTVRSLLRPRGTLHIADYGEQRSRLMRALFRNTVQRLDGIEDTQPNADGVLPTLFESCGFEDIEETAVIPTPTGSISLYRCRTPG